MSGPSNHEIDDADVLLNPRRVPVRVWIGAGLVLAAAVVWLVVSQQQERPHTPPTRPAKLAVSSDAGATVAPSPAASDVLLPGTGTGNLAAAARLVYEVDVRNYARVELTVRYPIQIIGTRHRSVAGARAGIYKRANLAATATGTGPRNARLVRLRPGSTSELIVSIPVDCNHPNPQQHLDPAALRAVVTATPATGAAAFALVSDRTSFHSMIDMACATS